MAVRCWSLYVFGGCFSGRDSVIWEDFGVCNLVGYVLLLVMRVCSYEYDMDSISYKSYH